jgi:hypothetical protein
MSHGTSKTAKPHPHEATLAKDKGVHDRINFNLDIKWRHAPFNGNT